MKKVGLLSNNSDNSGNSYNSCLINYVMSKVRKSISEQHVRRSHELQDDHYEMVTLVVAFQVIQGLLRNNQFKISRITELLLLF